MIENGERVVHKYIGYSCDTTGYSGFICKEGYEKILNIGWDIMPESNMVVSGCGVSIFVKFDSEATLVPGLRRNFFNSEGRIQGYYEYHEFGVFSIVSSMGKLLVKHIDESWVIFDDVEIKAEIVRVGNSEIFYENGMEMAEKYTVYSVAELSNVFLPYVLSIPVLGF